MNKWTQANDTRGIWHLPDGTVTEVESLLEVIPADWSREAPVIELTLTQKFELVRQALQASIDAKAYELGQFSSGDALIQYAGFTNAFQPLAQQFGEWEVSVWVQASAYRDNVVAGTAPMVTPEQAVAMMPAYPA